MQFCQNHWDLLKKAIAARGLNDLVSASGQEALKRSVDQLEGVPDTKENFDPLMGAHNMILNNAMSFCERMEINALAMLAPPEDHPEYGCPICFLNAASLEHDRTCTNPECRKEKGVTFESWIERAADDAASIAKELPSKDQGLTQ